jgi:hypothetical protein
LELDCPLALEGDATPLLEVLEEHPSLTCLSLRGHHLGAHDAKGLQALAKNHRVKEIDLSGHPLFSVDGFRVGPAVEAATLASNSLHGLSAVADAESLVRLDVSDNPLGQGVPSVNPSSTPFGATRTGVLGLLPLLGLALRELVLARCFLTDADAEELVPVCVSSGSRLQRLDLESNRFTAWAPLAKLVAQGSSLEALRLGENSKLPQSLDLLADALWRNASLTSLTVGHRGLRIERNEALSSALQKRARPLLEFNDRPLSGTIAPS